MSDLPREHNDASAAASGTWSYAQLLKDVRQLHGAADSDLLRPCLQSISVRQDHAKFHFSEARRILRDVVGERSVAEILTDFILPVDLDIYGNFHAERYKVEAHVIALLHCMHSMADSLAHVVYYAMGMRFDADRSLKDREIAFPRVRKGTTDGGLGALMDEFSLHDGFKYLAAIVNHSKHRSVVRTPYTVDNLDTESPDHGLNFAAFSYNGQWHSERRVEPFVRDEFARQSRLIIDIGNRLNTLVALRRSTT